MDFPNIIRRAHMEWEVDGREIFMAKHEITLHNLRCDIRASLFWWWKSLKMANNLKWDFTQLSLIIRVKCYKFESMRN